MTEHICRVARKFRLLYSPKCRIEIHYSFEEETPRSPLEVMKEWLGADLCYQPQIQGNLSSRLVSAFKFQRKNQKAIVIEKHKKENQSVLFLLTQASDTPSITPEILRDAFQELDTHQVVLGGATDGGYYLLGSSLSCPSLFTGTSSVTLHWSSSTVFAETVAICNALHLSLSTRLPQLSDIDRPEDLGIWDEVTRLAAQEMIMPVWNEVTDLTRSLSRTLRSRNVEVLLVDGGSTDGTLQLAQEFQTDLQGIPTDLFNLKIYECEKGRSKQLNAGAAKAEGAILLFVHGDTQLPPDYDLYVREALRSSKCIAGAFSFEIFDPEKSLNFFGRKAVQIMTNLRAKYLQMPYGDQCLFILPQTFHAMGGFPPIALMEDFELMRQLKQKGPICILPVSAPTSGRRWKQLGIIGCTILNQIIIIAYLLGMDPVRLMRWYYHKKID